MNKTSEIIKKFNYTPLLHIVFWGIFLFLPIFVFPNRDGVNSIYFFRHIVTTISIIIVFYLNYFIFINKLILKKKWNIFILCNVIVFTSLSFFNYFCYVKSTPLLEQERMERMEKEKKEVLIYMEEHECGELEAQIEINKAKKAREKAGGTWSAISNIFTYICTLATAAALISAKNYQKNEEERIELERTRVEAELKNLKSQLNPHFLFNTLNNIYALIAISQDKSQEAVMELSKMLRYVLYEADTDKVPISKEIDFINNYVQLMKLRLSSKVEVNVETDIESNPNLEVAPLLFISLIENAFKHGVSSNKNSFIHFSIKTDNENSIICELRNSHFPKTEEQDKSGSGIGIENLKRRLALIYPNAHTYTYGVDGDTYFSNLTIKQISNPKTNS